MKRVLLVDDEPTDLHMAANVVRAFGIQEIEARPSASAAKTYLEDALGGKIPMPEMIVLDLGLGYESGFELLRFWHGTPRLAGIRLVVWSVMAEEQQELCRMFKVDAVVPKWEAEAGLRRVLGPIISENP